MIYVILGICIFLFGLGVVLICKDHEEVGLTLCATFGVMEFIFFIVLLVTLGCYNSTKSTADNKIRVYEEQNKIIMAQIEPLIEKYLNYEKETFSNLKVDSNTLVAMSMYPELKGDEFVQSQIKIAMNNQNRITELKLNKANLNAYKMWIFMGE
jgi:hypothetical protein